LPRWASKILLLLGGLLVALLLAEVAARLLWSSLEPPEDVLVYYPVTLKPFPGRGYFPVPNSTFDAKYDGDPYGTLPEGNTILYSLNEAGFRERSFTEGGAEGDPVVAVLGDSFVFGEGVEQDKTLTVVAEEILRARLIPEARVLNLGISGFATEDERDLAKAVLGSYGPQLVIVGYCLNDPVHWDDERQLGLMGFDLVVRRDDYIAERREEDSPFYLVRLLERRLETLRLTEESLRWYRWMYEGEDAPWTRTRNYLLEIRREAKRHGAPMAVFLFPIFYRLEEDYPFWDLHEIVEEWCRSEGIPVYDTLELFAGKETESLVVHPKDHHPNAGTHRVLGEALADFIEKVLPEEHR
jgi:lysophospholipase L1-like esterase